MLRQALLTVIVLSACDRRVANRPAALLRPAAVATTLEVGGVAIADAGVLDAAAVTSTVVGWITFVGPPYENETPMHGGPPWNVYAPKLPARIRSTGSIVVAIARDRGLSSVPNLTVHFFSAGGARRQRSIDLLTVDEFDHALDNGTTEKRAAFATLGATVRTRVEALNRELDRYASDLVPFESCTIDPRYPDGSWPPCAAPQKIQCGAVSLRYLGGRQILETPHGRRSFPAWRKLSIRTNDGYEVAVNECVDASWLDPTNELLALRIQNICAAPGDWCSVESDWRSVRLGK